MSDSLIGRKSISCTLTGHRKLGKGFDIVQLERAVDDVINKGVTIFYCGMATGFDLIAAKVVLERKSGNRDIKLIACVPCPDQERYYTLNEKKIYSEVLNACDEVKLVSEKYFNGCMLVRDRFMVDNCETVLAYLDGRNEGGTAYTVRYARCLDRRIYII